MTCMTGPQESVKKASVISESDTGAKVQLLPKVVTLINVHGGRLSIAVPHSARLTPSLPSTSTTLA